MCKQKKLFNGSSTLGVEKRLFWKWDPFSLSCLWLANLTTSMTFSRAVFVNGTLWFPLTAPKSDSPAGQPNKDVLLERQKEYRMAALKAKQAGDIDQAKMHIKTSKVRHGF